MTTTAEQGAAPDRLQLRSFLAALPAAGELGRCIAARSVAGTVTLIITMFTWFKRVLAASVLGFVGAVAVPFLSIEVYRFLLRLGADNYQILIRLSNRFQTPAEFFTQEMILFGAILGVGSGYMLTMQHERRLREVWMLSKICSVFAILFLYSLLVHPLYIILGKQEKANALPLVFTSFLVPALWSVLLLLWGYKVYGGKELATKQWNRQKVKKELAWAIIFILVLTILD